MKFSLSWLRDHLETEAPLGRILEVLTQIGLEVEGVEDRGAGLGAFRIAAVVSAEPHPNADRLRACRVDAGEGEVSVVCGAPNARAGMRAVFAPPGSVIPASGAVLRVTEVRGVASEGMLLSLREMGLGEDHTGIVELPGDAPVGAAYARWAGLDDPVVEVAVTPNRGDALAVRGIARDLAVAGLGTLKPWRAERVPGRFASPIAWAVEWPAACPWVLGRTVRGLRNGPSPDWLQRRLVSVGLRPISALVDVTNLFTLDLGRPLHVFDVDKVRGGRLTMRPGAGERFRALNGRDYEVTNEDLVIADEAGVQSLAGVIGGEATGCDEGTTACFIECALFDPVQVALAGRRHAVASDARQRFERGIDPALLPAALEAATGLILELCGGEASEVVAAGAEPRWQRSARLRFERLGALGGLDVPADEAVATLERLGFAVEAREKGAVTVAVPSWRNDIAAPIVLDQAPGLDAERARDAAEGCAAIEPEVDLVEEVLRIRGLEAVPTVSMPGMAPVPRPTLTPRQVRTAQVRRLLAGRGLLECVTFSFMASGDAGRFGPAPAALRLANPIASDLDQLRPTPVATLALAARRNAARGFAECALFEIGPAFREDGQEVVAAGLRVGLPTRRWDGRAQAPDALTAKADAWAALAALGVAADSLSATADAPGWYHPGRSGLLRQGPKLALASFGELHPAVMTGLDMPGPAVAFEVFLDRIPEPKRRRRAGPELPALQPVRRDFAFVVGREVAAESVLRAARGAERGLITAVALFDVYEGAGVSEGHRSLGVEVTLQPRERALTDAEIEAASAKVVAAVAKATGGVLR